MSSKEFLDEVCKGKKKKIESSRIRFLLCEDDLAKSIEIFNEGKSSKKRKKKDQVKEIGKISYTNTAESAAAAAKAAEEWMKVFDHDLNISH